METVNMIQTVFDQVSDFLPADWRRVVFAVEYGEASYSMEFYVKGEDEAYHKCFDLPDVEFSELLELFARLDGVFSEVRNELEADKRWMRMTLCVDANGEFSTDFDYVLGEDPAVDKQRWKRRYLEARQDA